jgi:hypothetical protein
MLLACSASVLLAAEIVATCEISVVDKVTPVLTLVVVAASVTTAVSVALSLRFSVPPELLALLMALASALVTAPADFCNVLLEFAPEAELIALAACVMTLPTC